MSIKSVNSNVSEIKTTGGIPEKQESTRGYLAIGFSVAFFLLLGVTFVYVIFGGNTLDVGKIQIINMIFASLSGLVGTILGFYFGQSSK